MASNKVWVVRAGDEMMGAGMSYHTAAIEAIRNGLGGAVAARLEEGVERGASVVVLGGGYSIAHEAITGGASDGE
jgi:hypothetical protein